MEVNTKRTGEGDLEEKELAGQLPVTEATQLLIFRVFRVKRLVAEAWMNVGEETVQ